MSQKVLIIYKKHIVIFPIFYFSILYFLWTSPKIEMHRKEESIREHP